MKERLVVKSPFGSRDEFVRRFRRHFHGKGVFVPARDLPAVGQEFVLEIKLSSGEVVFGVDVKVAWIREQTPRGIGFEIVAAEGESRELWEEILRTGKVVDLASARRDAAAREGDAIAELEAIARGRYDARGVSRNWTGERLAEVDRALDGLLE